MTFNKVLIFDFDGTLVNSNVIKSRIFHQVFPELSIEEIDVFSSSTIGNRYEIIKNLDKKIYNIDRVYSLADRIELFDTIAQYAVGLASEIPGVSNFLALAHKKNIPMFISSATPENHIIDLIHKRGWSKYFLKILGSPTSKVSHIKYIQKRVSEMTELQQGSIETVYIGDARQDFDASIKANIKFTGIFIGGHIPEWATESPYAIDFKKMWNILEIR